LALIAPFFTGLSLSILVGALLVVGALVHVAGAFSAGSFWNVIWQVVLGVLYGISGILFLANPVLGLATLSLLLIGFLLASGVVQLGWAVTGAAGGSRIWLAVSGLLTLVLAALLWAGFPLTAAWLVGVYFGVSLLTTGISIIVHARAREPAPEAEPSGVLGGT
jgi:uncharacterized membrane protein HdeD (DUF308 family)